MSLFENEYRKALNNQDERSVNKTAIQQKRESLEANRWGDHQTAIYTASSRIRKTGQILEERVNYWNSVAKSEVSGVYIPVKVRAFSKKYDGHSLGSVDCSSLVDVMIKSGGQTYQNALYKYLYERFKGQGENIKQTYNLNDNVEIDAILQDDKDELSKVARSVQALKLAEKARQAVKSEAGSLANFHSLVKDNAVIDYQCTYESETDDEDVSTTLKLKQDSYTVRNPAHPKGMNRFYEKILGDKGDVLNTSAGFSLNNFRITGQYTWIEDESVDSG